MSRRQAVPRPMLAPVETPEVEVHRCLGYATVLLTPTATAPDQRLLRIDGARHWLWAALARLEDLARDAERDLNRDRAELEVTELFVPGPGRWRGRR